MNEIKLQKDEIDKGASLPKIYSPTFQPLLQSLLATLADIDFDYEQERERLSSNSSNSNIKIRALEKLKARHRERREPYIQQLAILQQRMMDLRVS